jgi:hypothetical protein
MAMMLWSENVQPDLPMHRYRMDISHGVQSLILQAMWYVYASGRMARGDSGEISGASLCRDRGITTHGHKARQVLLEDTPPKAIEVLGTDGIHDVQEPYRLHHREE